MKTIFKKLRYTYFKVEFDFYIIPQLSLKYVYNNYLDIKSLVFEFKIFNLVFISDYEF